MTLVASDDRRQEAARIHAVLQSACARLEHVEEHVIAAYVGHAIALLEERYAIDGGSGATDAD